MKKWMASFIVLMLLFSVSSVKADAAGFVGFGDSNTEGKYFEKQYPNHVHQTWVKQTGATNAGVSGNDTNQAMKRFQTDVLARNPTSVSIMFGQNDGLLLNNGQPQVSKAQFEKNMTSMVKQLKTKKVKVLLMTSIPVQQTLYYNKYPEVKPLYANKGGIRLWLNSYNEIIRKVAKKEKVYLVDHYANAVLKAGGATDAKLAKSGLVDEELGFHWTPKGHNMMTYSVQHYLAK